MTPKELKARVDDIAAMADDDEAAHSEEDQLREDVLRYIAWHPRGRNNHELAAIALSTGDIKFLAVLRMTNGELIHWDGEQIDGPDGHVWVRRRPAIHWRDRALAAEQERTALREQLQGAVDRLRKLVDWGHGGDAPDLAVQDWNEAREYLAALTGGR